MALVDVGLEIAWPTPWLIRTTTIGAIATLDAAGEYIAFIGVASRAMVVSHIGFWMHAVSGSPTADIRVETVGADGLPSGTLWATNTNIVTGTLTANSWNLVALTASASIAAGQVYCIKIAYNSGTSFAFRQITATQTNYYGTMGRPYRVINTGTPTKSAHTNCFPLVLGSSSTTFYKVPGLLARIADVATTFNNSTGARRGVRFQVPFPCRCVGFLRGKSAANGDHTVELLDDSGNELSSSSTAYDGDHFGDDDAIISAFDNPVTLAKDTWYRLVVTPTSATDVSLISLQIPSADYRSAMPGGTNFFLTSFTTAGGWVDTATDTVPGMSLLIDQLDDGASAGGGAPGHGNMTGGMQ